MNLNRNPENIQQAVSGFNTVAVIPGCCVVRVHEALDAIFEGCKHRYFISVDFKFRPLVALNIGKPGLYGVTKSEATREANQLASAIAIARNTLDSAKAHCAQSDTVTNRITVKRQSDRFDKLVSRYSAELL